MLFKISIQLALNDQFFNFGYYINLPQYYISKN